MINYFVHADKAEAHAKAKQSGGRWNKGQSGHLLVTVDLRVEGSLDEQFQDEHVVLCVVEEKLSKILEESCQWK